MSNVDGVIGKHSAVLHTKYGWQTSDPFVIKRVIYIIYPTL